MSWRQPFVEAVDDLGQTPVTARRSTKTCSIPQHSASCRATACGLVKDCPTCSSSRTRSQQLRAISPWRHLALIMAYPALMASHAEEALVYDGTRPHRIDCITKLVFSSLSLQPRESLWRTGRKWPGPQLYL
eukprot:746558-Hanusia_phi.AAC.3